VKRDGEPMRFVAMRWISSSAGSVVASAIASSRSRV
jgi:hypothetical protein